jgi:hypothetical protein
MTKKHMDLENIYSSLESQGRHVILHTDGKQCHVLLSIPRNVRGNGRKTCTWYGFSSSLPKEGLTNNNVKVKIFHSLFSSKHNNTIRIYGK